MNFVENYRKQVRGENLSNLDKIKDILKEQRDEIELLKYFISSYVLPKDICETDLGKKFSVYNIKVLSEIENWLLIDDEVCQFIEDYKSKQFSIKRLPHIFFVFVRRQSSERRFQLFKKEGEKFFAEIRRFKDLNYYNNEKVSPLVKSLLSSLWLKVVTFFFSSRTVKEIFNPITADWQEEYFEALSKKEIWKARWINVRYTYAFLGAMWQKSPLGDLIEFISKLAK